jgi:hypothetical protein
MVEIVRVVHDIVGTDSGDDSGDEKEGGSGYKFSGQDQSYSLSITG